jgi:hypothetical protein
MLAPSLANLHSVKIHYTFDKNSRENCLARWPNILQIQTIPLDERNSIGVVDLKTCLQSVAQCSPELVGDTENDYTVYAFDYSEPDTPLVGQGMFNWALAQSDSAQQQLVTGRVTKNLLAIFGNGIKETLEVKLKLTAVPKVIRATPAVHAPTPVSVSANVSTTFPPNLVQSSSVMSEATEWNTFVQSNPNLGHAGNSSNVSPVPVAIQPFNPAYESRNEVVGSHSQTGPGNPGSRPGSRPGSSRGSMEPSAHFNSAITPQASALSQVSTQVHTQIQAHEETVVAPPNAAVQPQSRPASRPSSRASTARPRGRPRKNPIPAEGNTSGYEDGTDGDEPVRAKKRAKTIRVERSNTATFGSAPESLRVAASTSGSLRNFRPISMGGEGSSGSHLQEVPRAPTPVPACRPFSGTLQSHSAPPSHLRGQSTSNLTERNGSFSNSYLDVNRSTSFGPDARSPTESLAPSPSQYSEGPSPADIGSSPPVPRSVIYRSAQSSPAPSSPILPPMRVQQIDSGFMSGGAEGSRFDDEEINKTQVQPPVLAAEKPKPKPKPRKSRAKKQNPPKSERVEPGSQAGSLIIQTETPGPPELLPTTSIYNPPNHQASHNHQRQPEGQGTPAMDQAVFSHMAHTSLQDSTPGQVRQQESNMAVTIGDMGSHDDLDDLERALMDGLEERNNHYFDGLSTNDQSFILPELHGQTSEIKVTAERAGSAMDPPSAPRASDEALDEPELPPMVPASDPVLWVQSLHILRQMRHTTKMPLRNRR